MTVAISQGRYANAAFLNMINDSQDQLVNACRLVEAARGKLLQS